MTDRRGRTPLHCVCAGFRSPHRLAVVKMLLDLDASCATAVDERRRTTLSLIVDDYVEELYEALQDKTSRDQACKSIEEGGVLYDCWQVVSYGPPSSRYWWCTLEEWDTTPNNEIHVGGKFQYLHAAVGISGCPAVIIRLILKLSPSSIVEKDGDMNLPLHVPFKINYFPFWKQQHGHFAWSTTAHPITRCLIWATRRPTADPMFGREILERVTLPALSKRSRGWFWSRPCDMFYVC